MSNSARPLKIAIVSPDLGVLHELSWVLTAFGYTVVTSKDVGESAAWRQFGDTDFLLFDGRTIADPTPTTLTQHSDNPIYRIFLYDPATSMDLPAWFDAGANDALRVPVSRGELLARVRTGARILEFQRRMRSQSSRSRLPGMHSERGLLRKLSKFTTEGKSVTLGHTLLTIAIDYFSGFCREEGELAARGVLTALATSIQQSVGGNAIAAYHDNGIFQVLLPGRKAASAHVIAGHIAQKFRDTQTVREPRSRLTMTTAIVPWQVGMHAEQLLHEGLATLAIGEQSGGDCTVEHNEFEKEFMNWQNELTAGNPFANMIAQDIMEPFPAVLQRDSLDRAMLAALHRSAAPVWPFVDRDGRLVGISAPELATDAANLWGPGASGNQALTKPDVIAHNAGFPEIYEAFSTQDCTMMVVVADHRPLGYLTRNGFLSLLEPIHSATYSSDESTPDDSSSLLVTSLGKEVEPAFDSDQ